MDVDDPTRVILKQLKPILLQTVSVKQKFEQVVQTIAQELCVGVCSIYALNQDGTISLFATEGLSREAVGALKFGVGVGIVGQIFKDKISVNISNVWNNEFFTYFPETAEDPYYTMIGVPIIFREHVIAALVVQNRPNRPHPENHQRILEAIAGVLSGFLARSGAVPLYQEAQNHDSNGIKTVFLSGGAASGRTVVGRPDVLPMYGVLECSTSEDLSEFRKMFQEEFNFLDHREQAHISLIMGQYDFKRRILAHVESGLNPVCAVQTVYNMLSVRLNAGADVVRTLRKFSRALILSFADYKFADGFWRGSKGFIILADHLDVHDLASYIFMGAGGAVVKKCSEDSHIVLLARALGLPLARSLEDLDGVVDGQRVNLNPTKSLLEFSELSGGAQRDPWGVKPPDFDGESVAFIRENFPEIDLRVNISLLKEAEAVKKCNFLDASGLVRTEMLFCHLPGVPTERIQIKTYKKLFECIPSDQCRVRLFDVSQDQIMRLDKPLVAWKVDYNEDMGLRGARVLLNYPEIILQQVRALLAASDGRDVYISVPMVACVDELRMFREIISSIDGVERIKMGLLLEVPAAVASIESFMGYIDFIQLGTNDLMQFFYAIDRDAKKFYSKIPLSVLTGAFMSLVEGVLASAQKHNKSCIICGVAATRPLELIAFHHTGFRTFSLPIRSIDEQCAALKEFDIQAVRDAFDECRRNNVYDIEPVLLKCKRH